MFLCFFSLGQLSEQQDIARLTDTRRLFVSSHTPVREVAKRRRFAKQIPTDNVVSVARKNRPKCLFFRRLLRGAGI